MRFDRKPAIGYARIESGVSFPVARYALKNPNYLEYPLMWAYLLAANEWYPDPAGGIRSLAELEAGGGDAFLKLSPRDDAPLKGGLAGELILLCTREDGDWAIHAEARLKDSDFRGPTPESVVPIYGTTGDRHWWRALTDFRTFEAPLGASELGIDESALPRAGRAHVVRIGQDPRKSNGHRPTGKDSVDRRRPDERVLVEAEIRTVSESSEDVIIDEQGRIFRLTGERISRPGHDPEIILRSLAAANSGRVVSLGEIRARRS